MKRWILSLALLTLGFTASAQNDLIDRGELAPEIAAASGEKMEWLPSFNGVIVEGLFRIRFERVPMDQDRFQHQRRLRQPLHGGGEQE